MHARALGRLLLTHTVLLAPGCAPGCTGSELEGTAARIDLLVRRPDQVLEEPGVLLPTPDRVWGDSTGPGWSKDTRLDGDGRPYLLTNQPSAGLRLPATHATDRSILLTLWSPGAPAPRQATILLNDRPLGSVEVDGAPREVALETHAELWRIGDNALEIASPEADGVWHPLALASVAYGTERRPTFDAASRSWSLPSETGLRFVVDVPDGSSLDFAGTAGAGTCTLRAGTVDPATGEGELHPFASTSGEIGGMIQLPSAGGHLLRIELFWSSPSGDVLTLPKLEVVESERLPRPSVVLISIDTWAARHLSVYGYDRPTTPNLEALARESIVFERCVANAPWTMPSYLSVMTGLYPSSHLVELEESPGLHFDNWDYWQVAESRWTLAEALRARGYRTAASVDTLWLSPKFRIDQGFDLYDMEPAAYGLDDRYHGIRCIVDRFGPWLDDTRDPAAPFFAFIHALDAHGPYWPDEEFARTFQGDLPADLRPTPAGSAHLTYRAIPMWMARTLVENRTEEHPPIPPLQPLEEIIARYDETILETDAHIGRLIGLLKERGLYDDCVVVVTADHGESFAHQTYSHGNLWEDIVHVPLIVKLPGGEHGGMRFDSSVELVDVYPTLMDLCGARASRAHLHGRSLLAGIGGEAFEPAPTFCEGGHIEQYMVEDRGWKLIELWPATGGDPSLLTHPRVPDDWLRESFPELAETGILSYALWDRLKARPDYEAKLAELRTLVTGPFHELYDLNTDPLEQHDLSAERPEVVARLLEILEERKLATRAARGNARSDVSYEPFADADLDQLRALGYGGEDEKR